MAASMSSTASGIFRGLLGTVGSSAPGSHTPMTSNPALEQRMRELEQELSVLQEELESKITENERLVIECCELKRDKRDIEGKYSNLETTLVQCNRERESMFIRLEKVCTENLELVNLRDSQEIRIDSLTREIELQNENVSKYKSLSDQSVAQISGLLSNKETLESDLRETRNTLSITESMFDQFKSEFSTSSKQCTELQNSLSYERAINKSLSLRIQQLEEDISISVAVIPVPEVQLPTADSIPKCEGEYSPCCHRAEYYQSRCHNLEYSLKAIKSKMMVVLR